MAINDIQLAGAPLFGPSGSLSYPVALGATAILVGEPVVKILGGTSVTVAINNCPQVGTDYVVGIATSKSTHTASAAGYVQVMTVLPGQVYSIKPKIAATWDTQTKYNNLVGKRVLIDLTSTSYTLLAADNANNGCVVMPMNITEDPGKVHFSFRSAAIYLA